MWFIQISDIHLQEIERGKQYENLKVFGDKILPSVNPSHVLATGDISNGINPFLQSM